MAAQIGPKIGIEGEKEYRQQLKQIIDQTKTLDSQMKASAAAWDKNTSEMSKNRTMAQNTQQQLGLFNEKIEILNTLLQESTEKFGENSSAAMSYQRAINATQATINQLNQEMKGFKGAEGFSEASVKLADVGTKMQNIGQSMVSVGQKLTTSLTVPIVAVSTAAIKFGSDLEESANKVDVVFGSMSQSVREFAQSSLEAYAISEGKALEMAGDYGAMATSMGMSQQEAAKLATEMVGLAGDMASFHNKSIEIAQNSLKGVFTGETESLKQFGVAMTQTNLEDFAARQGKVYDKMSQADKVMLRYQYLLESQRDAIGDAGRTMDGFAGSTRKLQGAFEEAAAALGQALIPLVTPLVTALTRLLQIFANLPAPIQKFIAVVLLIVAAIGPIILIIGSLMTALGGIITQAPIIGAAFMSMIPAIQSLAAAFGELTLAAAPWLVLAAAIVAAGYLIYANWDSISDAASSMAESVRNAFDRLMDINDQLKSKVHGIVSSIIDAFKSLPSKIAEAIRDAIKSIKDTFEQMVKEAKQSGQHMIEGFVDGIKEKVGKVVDAVKNVAKTVQDFLGFSRPDKGPLHEYEEWMPHFMQGLAQGINRNKGYVTKAINSLSKDMVLPLDSSASMNMALAGADGGSATGMFGGMVMNVSVDHISELNDLLRIQNQAQQMYRMGAR